MELEGVSKDNDVIKISFRKAQEDRFINFIPEKIILSFYGAFLVGRRFKIYKKNLSPLP